MPSTGEADGEDNEEEGAANDDAGASEDVDKKKTLPDIVCEDCADDITSDRNTRIRVRSKSELIEEAASERHNRSHVPHNPHCEVRVRAHMRQHSTSKKKERDDDEVLAITGPFWRLSADHM